MLRQLTPVISVIAVVTFAAPCAQAQQEQQGQQQARGNDLASSAVPQRMGGLSPDARRAAREALQATLFDVIALRYQVQQAHWNVVGEEFYQLHDLTGDFYVALNDLVDLLGEQRLARGAPSTAVVGEVAEHAKLAEMPQGYITGAQLVDTLTKSYSMLSANLTERIGLLGERGDLVSQDVLLGVGALVDKHLWLLRAHAQPAGTPASD